jgi:hypothetical protein
MRVITFTPENLSKIDVTQAKATFEETAFAARPNSLTPWDGTNPSLGTWRLDPDMGEWEVLLELDLEEVFPGEPEDYIKGWEGYSLYVQWAIEGKEAPAIRVVRHVDGHLVSCNRRRVLAAKDAGLKTIKAWFSETNSRGQNPWKTRTEGTVYKAKVKALKQWLEEGDYKPYPDDIQLLEEFGEWT